MVADPPDFTGGSLYEHLGISSRRLDDATVETLLPIGEGEPATGRLSVAALGHAFEHGAPLLAPVAFVPVVIAVHVRADSRDRVDVRVLNRLARLGRRVMVTDATAFLEDGTVIGFGTITWSVTGALPDGTPVASSWGARPRPRLPDAGLLDVVGVRPLPDGTGCEVAAVGDRTAGPGRVLHAGAIQLLCEEAALIAARAGLPSEGFAARDCLCHLLEAGRHGPFVARGQVLVSGDDGADCRVEVRDEVVGAGAGGKVIAFADVRVGWN